MEQYLIDTNVISGYLSSALSEKSMLFIDGIIDLVPNLSVITQIELLSWNASEEIEKKVEDFIVDSNVLNISPEIIKHCASLRKKRKIKTPDAIIAATALAYGFILVTNNEGDFSNIKGLKLISPRSL